MQHRSKHTVQEALPEAETPGKGARAGSQKPVTGKLLPCDPTKYMSEFI